MTRYLPFLLILGCSFQTTVIVEKDLSKINDAGMVLDATDGNTVIEDDAAAPHDAGLIHPFDARSNQDFSAKCLPYDTNPPTRSPWYETLDDEGGVLDLYHCPGSQMCYDDTLNKTIQCL